MKLSVRLIQQNNEIIANCPELDINCYASNRDEAVRRIKKVIHFYIEAAHELGLNVEKLYELNVDGETNKNTAPEIIQDKIHSIN